MLRPAFEGESFLELGGGSGPFIVCLEQLMERIYEGIGGESGAGLFGGESKGWRCRAAGRQGMAYRGAEAAEDGGRGGFYLFG